MSEATSGKKPRITPSPTGPFVVRGLEHLRNSKGERLRTRSSIALCRCGQSGTKPFCDGTHNKVGFRGDNTADHAEDALKRYAAPDVTILDNRFICAHIGACTDGLPAVFRYGEEPWIVPDGADAQRIRETVERCPSGALAHALGEEAAHIPTREPAITVSKDGPYFVVGGIALETESWAGRATRERYALCRCGQSKNKPFCDGSHWEAGFKDDAN